jgi:uncharacterized protein
MRCAIVPNAPMWSVRRRVLPGRFHGILNFPPMGGAKTGERSMQVDHHDLYQDFPEMRDAIDALKAGNAHFARLNASYDRLTGKVEDLEAHDMPVADFTLEDMKKQRVKLKDELYHLLLAFRAGQQAAR